MSGFISFALLIISFKSIIFPEIFDADMMLKIHVSLSTYFITSSGSIPPVFGFAGTTLNSLFVFLQ